MKDCGLQHQTSQSMVSCLRCFESCGKAEISKREVEGSRGAHCVGTRKQRGVTEEGVKAKEFPLGTLPTSTESPLPDNLSTI